MPLGSDLIYLVGWGRDHMIRCRQMIHSYIYFLYIYVPLTQMTLVSIGKDLLLEEKRITVKWVPGIYYQHLPVWVPMKSPKEWCINTPFYPEPSKDIQTGRSRCNFREPERIIPLSWKHSPIFILKPWNSERQQQQNNEERSTPAAVHLDLHLDGFLSIDTMRMEWITDEFHIPTPRRLSIPEPVERTCGGTFLSEYLG